MTTLKMPKVDRKILKDKDQIAKDICSFTKRKNVLSEREELKPYETDGFSRFAIRVLGMHVLPMGMERNVMK